MGHLQEVFRDGVEGYTPATMWFTSGNINKREMTRQIEGFKEKGINDFFIHPSNGTQGDYLGEHFFSMIRHAAEEAKRLGMHYWIYDEYNWPSGNAAGQVLVDEPWTHGSCLSRVIKTVAAGQTIRIDLPDRATNNTTPLLFVADGKAVDLVPEGDTVVWTNTASEEKTLEVYFSVWILRKVEGLRDAEVVAEGASGYLDTLDKEAVGVFIQKTHEAYKKHLGDGFGAHVKGVFTDEVTTFPQAFRETRPEYPWSRLFPEKFLERNGYDIRPKVKNLMDRTDPKVAVDYWETVTDLFMSAFMDQTYKWCEENGLIYTGHLLIEESIESTVCRSGDPYEYYKRFTWPGIDTILSYYRIDDYNYNITPKRATSAARFLGKERVLSETYTVSGWEIRLRDMKRIFNRLALLGINFIQYMGSRYDFILSENSAAMTNNWQNPLFKHYGELSRYISGVQWLVANTKPIANTLLFYPMTTARIQLSQLPIEGWNDTELDATLCGLTNSLMNLHVPFEIAFEQMIKESSVEDGKLVFEDGAYETIILPCTTYLKEETFTKLRQFAKAGGRVIEVNGKPEKIIGAQIYDALELEGAICYDCRDYERIFTTEDPLMSHRAPMGAFTECLKEALCGVAGMVAKITPCDGILSSLREKDGAYYIMIINDNSTTTCAEGEILLDLPYRAINTETGKCKAMKTNGRHFAIELAAYECVIVEVSAAAKMGPEPAPVGNRTELTMERVTFAPDGLNNALPTMYQVRGKAAEDIIRARSVYNPKRVCDLANALGEDDLVPCRAKECVYPPAGVEIDWLGWYAVDKKQPGAGETVVCIYDFTADFIPEDLELISDPQYNTVWYLNNEQLYQTGTKRIWHYANPVFDLSGIATCGKNRLIAICTYPDYSTSFTLPCAVLKGSFRFFEDLVLTQKPGGNALNYWNLQGYLCYTGDGTYSCKFTAPSHGRVILEIATNEAAEVLVNGTSAGKRLWDPYTLDLTPYLVMGENTLDIRITSTLSSLLYKDTPCGLKDAKLYHEV